MKQQKIINVFIASPGDLPEEREIVREVCEELNKSNLLRPYGISFEAVGWEETFSAIRRPIGRPRPLNFGIAIGFRREDRALI